MLTCLFVVESMSVSGGDADGVEEALHLRPSLRLEWSKDRTHPKRALRRPHGHNEDRMIRQREPRSLRRADGFGGGYGRGKFSPESVAGGGEHGGLTTRGSFEGGKGHEDACR